MCALDWILSAVLTMGGHRRRSTTTTRLVGCVTVWQGRMIGRKVCGGRAADECRGAKSQHSATTRGDTPYVESGVASDLITRNTGAALPRPPWWTYRLYTIIYCACYSICFMQQRFDLWSTMNVHCCPEPYSNSNKPLFLSFFLQQLSMQQYTW
jgi:hypothetical protein